MANLELILQKDVESLGKIGDVVKVSPGYGRNFLIPKGLAAPVNSETLQFIEKERARLKKEEAVRVTALKAQAKKLSALSVTVSVKVGEEGQMFGSVTAADIAKAIEAEGVEIDPKAIVLDQPIKILGVANVGVKLHPEVTAQIKVWVVEE